ncbi:MAG: hypothetical protein HON90_01995 [Halobacteriovoraceae bacterium]|jgi:hypothetical protein|nr:hypothetical protein [Halobacteriovoraceae bacterium]
MKSLIILSILFMTQTSLATINPGGILVNEEYQQYWSLFSKQLTVKIKEDLLLKLNQQLKEDQEKYRQMRCKTTSKSGRKRCRDEVFLREIKVVNVELPNAPFSIKELTDDRFQLLIPGGTNEWGIHVKVKIRTFVNNSWLVYPSAAPDLDVKIKNIRIQGGFNYSLSDAGKFKTLGIIDPEITYKVSTKLKYNKFKWFFKKLNKKIKKKLNKKITASIPELIAKVKSSFENMAEFLEQPKLTADISIKVPEDKLVSQETIDSMIAKIDRGMFEKFSPHGILAKAEYKNPHDDSWIQDFHIAPQDYKPGEILGYNGYNDSAIWTGNYLASQSFRYMVTKSQDSIASMEHALSGIEMLLKVNGNSGLLSRAAAPSDSIFGKSIIKHRRNYSRVLIDGVEWISHHGDRNGISRDQYAGVYFGLSIMYDSLGDEHQNLKNRAAKLVSMMTHYIIKNNWSVTEDRGGVHNPTVPGTGPTLWSGPVVKFPILTIAHHMDPQDEIIAKELELASDLSDTAWLSIYFAVLDPIKSYFKFNLENMNFYNYLRLERNEKRKAGMLKAYNLLEQYIGHHGNVYFRLLRRHLDPTSIERAKESSPMAMREIFTKLFQKNHREAIPKNIDYSGIPLVDYKSYDGKISKRPAGPIDLSIRYNTGSFQWQRNPYSLNPAGEGTPKVEMTGMSMSMVYWMARAVNEGFVK